MPANSPPPFPPFVRYRRRLTPRLAALCILLLGYAASIALSRHLYDVNRRGAAEHAAADTRQLALAVERELNAHLELLANFELTQRLVPFFVTPTLLSADLKERQRQVLLEAMSRRPAARAVGFARYVPAAGRDQFETSFSGRDGGPLRIVEPGTVGPRAAAGRDQYFPFIFFEARHDEAPALGSDLTALPQLAALVERARRSGQAAIEPSLGEEAALGTNCIIAVYPAYTEYVLTDAEGPGLPFIGVVVGLFDVQALLERAIAMSHVHPLAVKLRDITNTAAVADLAAAAPEAQFTGNDALAAAAPLTAGGRTWEVVGAPRDDGYTRNLPALIAMLGGGAFSTLLALYTSALLSRAQRRVEYQQQLEAREAWFRSLVHRSSDLVVVVDKDGIIRYVSDSVERILGYRPDELRDQSVFTVLHPEQQAQFQKGLRLSLFDGIENSTIEAKVRHADGSWRVLEATETNLLHDPYVQGLVENLRDITERRRLEVALTKQAFQDTLTGVASRAAFVERVTAELAGTDYHGGIAVLVLDVDNFTGVNESMGYQVGDHLLTAIGQRLVASTGPNGVVARTGGDEFAVLFSVEQGPFAAEAMVATLLEAIQQPYELDDREILVTAGAGLAQTREGDADWDAAGIIRAADVALHQAKAAGRGQFACFTSGMAALAGRRIELESSLRQAIRDQQLDLVFQPQIDPRSGRIRGMEALTRWQHPRLGVVAPAAFIAVAEESGLIIPLGSWVLRTACAHFASWLAGGLRGKAPVLSVNVSTRQLMAPDFPAQVRSILQEFGLPVGALCLEITETALIADAVAVRAALDVLVACGVRLALDDFGTGYASLTYLQELPVSSVKLDQSFIAAGDGRTQAIVETITALAHNLDMTVIAEGVETKEQLAAVLRAGCDAVQGYYYAPALPAEEMEQLLLNGICLAAG